MEQIPAKKQAHYEHLLFDKEIPRSDHPDYEKWLRYYLDSCVKYGFTQLNPHDVGAQSAFNGVNPV